MDFISGFRYLRRMGYYIPHAPSHAMVPQTDVQPCFRQHSAPSLFLDLDEYTWGNARAWMSRVNDFIFERDVERL